MITINVINESKNELPMYATEGSAGMDLRANLENTITIQPFDRVLISTGLKIALPVGYEAQVRPRSGLALKKGITVLNTPGTIDSDYRGDIGVILINFGKEAVKIEPGERIAQMIINKYETITWKEVDSLEKTERGDGGFGSTGNQILK
jgi:dUTP pyrophosphatase